MLEPRHPGGRVDLSWTSGVRAVCALVVLAYHGLLTAVPDGLPGAGQLLVQGAGTAGHAAVLVFVTLSGFLLGRSWRQRLRDEPGRAAVLDFLTRRSWRILPAYWVALGVTVVVMVGVGLDRAGGTHWDTGLPLTGERLLVDALLLSDVAGQVPLNHPLWTVPVEYHLYLAAPLVALLPGRAALAALASTGTLALVLLAPGFSSPFFLFAFVTAFWVGGERRTARGTSVLRLLAPLVAVAAVVVVAGLVLGDLDRGPQRFLVVDAVAWVCVLTWLAAREGQPRPTADVRALSTLALVHLGERSYSFYLVHAVALELVWRGAVVPLGLESVGAQVAVVVLLGLVVSLAGAEVLWRLVERPTATRAQRRRVVVARPALP